MSLTDVDSDCIHGMLIDPPQHWIITVRSNRLSYVACSHSSQAAFEHSPKGVKSLQRETVDNLMPLRLLTGFGSNTVIKWFVRKEKTNEWRGWLRGIDFFDQAAIYKNGQLILVFISSIWQCLITRPLFLNDCFAIKSNENSCLTLLLIYWHLGSSANIWTLFGILADRWIDFYHVALRILWNLKTFSNCPIDLGPRMLS